MTQLPKRIAKKLLLLAVCCIAAGVFSFAPMSKISSGRAAAANANWYYAYLDTYYSDANQTDIVGEYNSCAQTLTGYRTPYKDTEIFPCYR